MPDEPAHFTHSPTPIPQTLAPEFLDALAEHGAETLRLWLDANAPVAVCALAEALRWLRDYQRDHVMNSSEIESAELLETVVRLVNAIAEAGGSFYMPWGRTRPRKTKR